MWEKVHVLGQNWLEEGYCLVRVWGFRRHSTQRLYCFDGLLLFVAWDRETRWWKEVSMLGLRLLALAVVIEVVGGRVVLRIDS